MDESALTFKDDPTRELQKQLEKPMIEDNAALRVASELAVAHGALDYLHAFATVSFHAPDGSVTTYARSRHCTERC